MSKDRTTPPGLKKGRAASRAPGEDERKASGGRGKTLVDSVNDAIFVHGPVTVKVDEASRRKDLEEELKQSEERLRFALETSRTGAWELDLIDHTASRSLEHDRIFGYERLLPQWTYEMFLEHVLPEDRPAVDATYRQAMASQSDWSFECRIRRVDGQVRWIWAAGRHRMGPSGKLSRMAGIVQDITETKQVEEALRKSEEKFRGLSEASPAAVFVYQGERHLYVNQAAVSIFGYTREELLHMNLLDLMHPDYRDMARDKVQARMRGHNKPDRYEMEIVTKSGEEKFLDVSTGLIDYGGFPAGIVVAIDVTKRRQVEEELLRYREKLEELVKDRTAKLEDKNRKLKEEMREREKAEGEKRSVETLLAQSQRIEAIDRFAGGIAHDLNNILYPIIMNIEELLEEEPHDTTRHEVLAETLKAAHRQRDLVKKILSFSRRSEHVRRPVRVKELLEGTVQFLKSSLPSTIVIRQRVNAEADTIMGDPVQIQQVIMNLCQNAADAYPSEKGVIEVGLTNTRMTSPQGPRDIQAGDYLKLTVQDSGVGMHPRVMGRIFEPFFTSKDVGKGTGMGLSVVHGIVKSHGGIITVESEEGRGSLFTVYFPALEGCGRDQEPLAESEPSPARGKGRILLIDDEEIILSSLQRALRSSGYQVEACRDGREALELFSEKPDAFDLVMTDLTMPGMTGLEVSKKVHGLRSDIPIVLCTGYNDAISQDEARSFGVKELLLKPVGAAELRKAIRRAIGQ